TQLVIFDTGISTTLSSFPVGETLKMHPPKNRQFHRQPSSSIAEPSGRPRSTPATKGRLFRIELSACSYSYPSMILLGEQRQSKVLRSGLQARVLVIPKPVSHTDTSLFGSTR